MPVHDSIVYGYNWNLQIAGPGKWNEAHQTELADANE